MAPNTRSIRNLSTSLFLAFALSILAGPALAQQQVAIQQQFFASHGDGSSGPDSFPCCNQPVTTMTTGGATVTLSPAGTYDTRTTKGQLYFAEFKLKKEYGTATVQPGGTVTLPSGIFQTNQSLMLVSPGGSLKGEFTTSLDRTVQTLTFAPGGGIAANHITPAQITQAPAQLTRDGAVLGNYFEYDSFANRATQRPTFRSTLFWTGVPSPTTPNPFTGVGPNASQAGKIRVVPSPQQYGGTRNILWTQLSFGYNQVTSSVFADFDFPVRYGPGVPFSARFDYNFTPTTGTFPSNTFMAADVVRRSTGEAGFVLRTAPTASAFTILNGPGTGWFTWVGFTSGTIQVLANTIGTQSSVDFSTRTEVGFNNLNSTTGGQITGELQLVSGALLQSRAIGGEQTNLAHTTNTLIKFAPEPGSAALIGAGAFGLIGMMVRDRRRSRVG